jgi:leucyl-tRNA synthetase
MMPILPHLANECFEDLEKDTKIYWPKYDEKYISDNTNIIVIQINGKKRGLVNAKQDLKEEDLMQIIQKDKTITKYLVNQKIKKKIFIKNRLLNIIL